MKQTKDGKSVIRIDSELLRDFKLICTTNKIDPSAQAADLVKRWVRAEAQKTATALRAKHA
jgi:hypothetical protein